jgi:polyhydroxyalkanoate synthesis regulator phasin
MSNAEPVTPEPAGASASGDRPIGSPRDFVLACIGLLSLLADELPALLERSVQRGSTVVERAQTDAKRRRTAPPEVTPQVSDELQKELSRLGLLTHRDLEMLLQQVTELERQIDQIAAQRSGSR